jgi:hypothetical protein
MRGWNWCWGQGRISMNMVVDDTNPEAFLRYPGLATRRNLLWNVGIDLALSEHQKVGAVSEIKQTHIDSRRQYVRPRAHTLQSCGQPSSTCTMWRFGVVLGLFNASDDYSNFMLQPGSLLGMGPRAGALNAHISRRIDNRRRISYMARMVAASLSPSPTYGIETWEVS